MSKRSRMLKVSRVPIIFFLFMAVLGLSSVWAFDINKVVSDAFIKSIDQGTDSLTAKEPMGSNQIRSKLFPNVYSNSTLDQEIDRWMLSTLESDSEVKVDLIELRQATRIHLKRLLDSRLKDHDFLRIHQITACYDISSSSRPILKAVYGRLSDNSTDQLFSVHHFVLDVFGNGHYTMADGGITKQPKLANYRLTVETLCLLGKTIALRAPYAGERGMPNLNAYQGLDLEQKAFINQSISDLLSNRTDSVENSRWHRLALCYDRSGKITAVVGMFNDYSVSTQKGRSLYENGIFYFTAGPGGKNNSMRKAFKHPEHGEADLAIKKLCAFKQLVL
ncbi:hypothetical protein [Limnobacter sp.]|uniref:hypothetical protein n=1 Tax=Limnobacter sp. TaxID=2003368 RepID=UPI0027B88FB1|nr:hypothetical protein [Limnobacter sp.]